MAQDNSKVPYRHPQPKESPPELVIPSAIPEDERIWVPQAENVWVRPLCLCASRGYWMNLLRVRKSGVLSRHRHPQPVHGYVIKGRWRYLEHDWVAQEGGYVYEAPGETHTLVVDEDVPEMITLFQVNGVMLYVDPARLVFAPPLPLETHLARHRLADLFLDTFPYTGHATACDALWAGLPVLTCKGKTYASRVSASLLSSAGLPELVTENAQGYEAQAVTLAKDAKLLGALRDRLTANRATCELFDTDLFRRRIEVAYTQMWQRWLAGEAPQAFTVAAD